MRVERILLIGKPGRLARAVAALAMWVAAIAHADAPAPAPLTLGILPHLSTDLLLKKYEPFIRHLEQKLGRPVSMSTARDFQVYARRVAEGRYDFYITAPHLAAYHEKFQHDRRLGRFARDLRAVFLVAKDAPYRNLVDLRDKVVTTADPLAVITLAGETMLGENGLVVGKSVHMRHMASHNAAIFAVADGHETAALVGSSVYVLLQEQTRDRLRVLAQTPPIPSMMIMARAGLADADYRQVKSAVQAFTASGAGAEFFKDKAYGDMIDITDADMHRLQPLIGRLTERLR